MAGSVLEMAIRSAFDSKIMAVTVPEPSVMTSPSPNACLRASTVAMG